MSEPRGRELLEVGQTARPAMGTLKAEAIEMEDSWVTSQTGHFLVQEKAGAMMMACAWVR